MGVAPIEMVGGTVMHDERAASRASAIGKAWQSLRAEPHALVALLFLIAVVLGAVLAGQLSPYGENQQNIGIRLSPPLSGTNGTHLLGTDGLGRDILSRLLHGARLTLVIPLGGVGLSMTLGVVLGLVAGFYGGTADAVIMRLADLQMALSTNLLILVIVVMVGPGVTTLVIVFGVAYWVVYARIIRGALLSLRESSFIEAARSIGCSDVRIMFLHVLPNLGSVLLGVATVEMARLMVTEAGLSFLGFGVQPPTVTWGLMIAAGREYLSTAWWLVTFPGLAIASTVLAISFVGIWLRDATSGYERRLAGQFGRGE